MLQTLAENDDSILVMTAENRAPIRHLPSKLGPRFIDVGICEQTMIGAAAGLALRGRKPIVHALASFLTLRAFEFIRTDIGLPALPVTLVGSVAGFLSGANGPTHQALEDIALMRGIPNVMVFCPADESELISGLPRVLDSGMPCYIRYNDEKPAVRHEGGFELGKSEQIAEGDDVAILTYGHLLKEAIAARQKLLGDRLSVRLVNLRMLKPVDEEAILCAARETRLIVTLEDHFITGGLYSLVSEILVRQQCPARILPIALANWFKPALVAEALEQEGFTGAQIAGRIERALDRGLLRA